MKTNYQMLIVDDIEMNRAMLIKIFGKEYTVFSAENGREAMYDAVLMDIQMPKMNGYEATRYIRESKHPQGKDIPIIAVTANAFTSDVRKSLEAGMNDHIAKPIDTERLYTSLDKLVGQN